VSNILLLSQAELATILNSSRAKVDRLERENAALRAWIREEGLRNNLCTYYVLDREICTNCECGRAARKEGGASWVIRP
jgi:hypothetical protein